MSLGRLLLSLVGAIASNSGLTIRSPRPNLDDDQARGVSMPVPVPRPLDTPEAIAAELSRWLAGAPEFGREPASVGLRRTYRIGEGTPTAREIHLLEFRMPDDARGRGDGAAIQGAGHTDHDLCIPETDRRHALPAIYFFLGHELITSAR